MHFMRMLVNHEHMHFMRMLVNHESWLQRLNLKGVLFIVKLGAFLQNKTDRY
jgi:hypothetical protein